MAGEITFDFSSRDIYNSVIKSSVGHSFRTSTDPSSAKTEITRKSSKERKLIATVLPQQEDDIDTQGVIVDGRQVVMNQLENILKFDFRACDAKTYTWKKRVSGHSALFTWNNGKGKRVATFIPESEPNIYLHTRTKASLVVLSEVEPILNEILATTIYVRKRYETWDIDKRARHAPSPTKDTGNSVSREETSEARYRSREMDGSDGHSSDSDSDGEPYIVDDSETAGLLENS
ncbi:hypothetical protein V5O48_012765 [Marasmius crinis-equi]|uniref:DUF6593 domain-containing protein n=1 Tax=Marasmius crinis-equi TaxID=585013 RepID=A0ABR3F2F4_9AGAR